MYLEHKKITEFEDMIGFDVLLNKNKFIGKTLGFEPRIEYAVCVDGSCCYSPKNVSDMYSDWRSQKVECDKWLKENNERFPDGWVSKEGHSTTKLEYYPQFHLDWNELIEAVKRLRHKHINFHVQPCDIFYTWQLVYQNCEHLQAKEQQES